MDEVFDSQPKTEAAEKTAAPVSFNLCRYNQPEQALWQRWSETNVWKQWICCKSNVVVRATS
jgi:hypothetical protein